MKQKFLISIFFIIFMFGYGIYNDLKLIENDYFSVNFFDMKLGDGILIKTPEGKIILIDGGVGDQMVSKISDVDYLKIAHHGSKTSSSTGFILASQPEFGIIMADDENRFRHPHEKVVSRLENFGVEILHTGEVGDIELKIY